MKLLLEPEIASNSEKLTSKLVEIFGPGLMGGGWTKGGGSLESSDMIVGPGYCGVLVMTKSGAGSVRVRGNGAEERVETGPNMEAQTYVMGIDEGQGCDVVGGSFFCIVRKQGRQ